MNSTTVVNSDEVVQIIIPSNSRPGDKINVRVLDGRTFQVTIPNGCSEGDALNVIVPTTPSIAIDNSTVSTHTTEITENKKILGAAGVAAAAGVLISGPLVGVVLAGGAVYATTRNDQIGEATKAVGEATVRAIEKGREIGNKYGIFDKMKSAASATYTKAKEINDEYKVTDQMKVCASSAATKAKEIDEKYKISETTSNAILSGVTAGAREVTKLAATSNVPAVPPR